MVVQAIKIGNFKVDKFKNFSYLDASDEKVLKMGIQPFLVTTDTDSILFDVGLGFLENDETIILKRLKEHGIDPSKITKILLSHLHKDHTDGLGYFDGDVFVQNFPHAQIYIQKREMDFALSLEDSPSYNYSLLQAIFVAENVVWLQENTGYITPEINYLVTGGHSPFHQVFWVRSSSEIIFYGADNLPTRGYLKRHIAFKTDNDGHKAMEWRKSWEIQAKKENWKVLLYHDLKDPILQF